MNLYLRDSSLHRHESKVFLDGDGLLSVRIIQARSGLAVLNEIEIPAALLAAESEGSPSTPSESTDAELTILSHCGGMTKDSFVQLGRGRDRGAVVTLAGRDSNACKDITYVLMGGEFIEQEKFSLSMEDEKAGVLPGDSIHYFADGAALEHSQSRSPANDAEPVRIAVLNCHEYSHAQIVAILMLQKIEVLVVVSHNAASRLYWEYARSDVHRLLCYVIIVNSAEFGGSAVFAPYRRVGNRVNAQFSANGQLFGARGAGAFHIDTQLDVGLLRKIRADFEKNGIPPEKTARAQFGSDVVLPSQHFLKTHGQDAGALSHVSCKTFSIGELPGKLRIAVAQLDSVEGKEYFSSGYRLEGARGIDNFQSKLRRWLAHVEADCAYKQAQEQEARGLLDLLVLPEVFVPRKFLCELQGFSDRTGAMIVAGVDYPEENANECAILRPNDQAVFYRKITRSQYDGLMKDGVSGWMDMARGEELVRFVDKNGRGIGVLICYDYSHLDLLERLNLEGRDVPLDIVVVAAHNPYGDLYRSSCIADSHRFYQYIAMSNVSKYGGSGVFGPVRTQGARQVLAEAGKNCETVMIVDVDLIELGHARGRNWEAEMKESKYQRRPGVIKRKFE